MPRRRELKDLAAGIASKFISRNNDLRGYWALGILFKDLDKVGGTSFSLNLLTKQGTPDLKNVNKVSNEFGDYLDQQLKQRGFRKSQVQEAILSIAFDVAPSKEHLNVIKTSIRGKPFTCSVKFLDDLGRIHRFTAKGWCSKHNPLKESRSARVLNLFAL